MEKTRKTPYRVNLPIAWTLTIVVSLGLLFGSRWLGKNGDCKPGDVDGQCGISTEAGRIEGVIDGALVFLVMGSYLTILSVRRRRQSRVKG